MVPIGTGRAITNDLGGELPGLLGLRLVEVKAGAVRPAVLPINKVAKLHDRHKVQLRTIRVPSVNGALEGAKASTEIPRHALFEIGAAIYVGILDVGDCPKRKLVAWFVSKSASPCNSANASRIPQSCVLAHQTATVTALPRNEPRHQHSYRVSQTKGSGPRQRRF